MPTVAVNALRGYVESVLLEAGWGAEHAPACVDLLIEASLRGIDSHGVPVLLPHFVRQTIEGAVDVSAQPHTVAETPGCVTLDARHAPGPSTVAAARGVLSAKAAAHGTAAVAIRNIGYLGAIGLLVRPLAVQGFVGILAATSEACVAPHGGREPLHGTNPLAAAIPAQPYPIVLDMRTNALRMGDYWAAIGAGGTLPPGTVITREGNPTTEPAATEHGVLLPLAGPKGYGLALFIDVLAAGLAGAPIGRELTGNGPARYSAFVAAFDPAAFGPEEEFHAAVARLVAQVHATEPLDPRERVRLPGERSEQTRLNRLRSGVPVNIRLWDNMITALQGSGIQTPPPAAIEDDEQ